MAKLETDFLIIGAGSIGVSVAHAIKSAAPNAMVCLIDRGQPMAYTSSQSGENYRNWWPHPIMKQFIDCSITLMERISQVTNDRINLTRRGYVLATRAFSHARLHADLASCYGEGDIRVYELGCRDTYVPPVSSHWPAAPQGVDVITNRTIIRRHFPYYDPSVTALIHIRRGGTVASQQIGKFMLEQFKEFGGTQMAGTVTGISQGDGFTVSVESGSDTNTVRARQIVNAAGPFARNIAAMIGIDLPIHNTFHQKITFEDTESVIDRQMPFSIDLDPQEIDWSDEERDLIASDSGLARYAEQMPGAIHCRPEGGDTGTWLKLGWAFNEEISEASHEPKLNEHFPEIVLRGAARLNPRLKTYYGRLPRNKVHYGGYYTMTSENWPLIGPMGIKGTFIAGAFSGFGTMAACAAGDLVARWLLGRPLPDYAEALSLARYQDAALMKDLNSAKSRGIL